jgi:hypothetical protein
MGTAIYYEADGPQRALLILSNFAVMTADEATE